MGYFVGGFRGAGTASTVRVQIKNPTQCLSWWRLSNIPMPQTVCNLCNVCVSGNRFEIECLNLVASTLLKLRQQKKHYACRTLLWHCVLIKSSTGRGNEVKISFASAISIRIYSRMMKWYVFDFTSCWILCLCVTDMMKDVMVFETAFWRESTPCHLGMLPNDKATTHVFLVANHVHGIQLHAMPFTTQQLLEIQFRTIWTFLLNSVLKIRSHQVVVCAAVDLIHWAWCLVQACLTTESMESEWILCRNSIKFSISLESSF